MTLIFGTTISKKVIAAYIFIYIIIIIINSFFKYIKI